MAEYIDKKELWFCEITKAVLSQHNIPVIKHIKLDDITPADVRENVRGEWILSGGYFRCSICNEKALLKLDKAKSGSREYKPQRTNFCPYCGAKMEKKGETP